MAILVYYICTIYYTPYVIINNNIYFYRAGIKQKKKKEKSRLLKFVHSDTEMYNIRTFVDENGFFLSQKKKIRKKADTRSRYVYSGFASYGMYLRMEVGVDSESDRNRVDLYLVFP